VIYEVVYCADCKKPLKSVPSWLAGVNVRFSCDSCRQRHPRTPVGYDAPAATREFAGDDIAVVADPIEAVEEEPIEEEIEAEDSPVISVED
jgi:hypothetical protein